VIVVVYRLIGWVAAELFRPARPANDNFPLARRYMREHKRPMSQGIETMK
jgi:hypothetical protein